MNIIVFNKDKFLKGFINHKYTIKNAGFNILHDTDFLAKLLSHDATCSILDLLSEKFLLHNRDFVKEAVSFFGDNFNKLPSALRNDKELALLAVNSSNYSRLNLGDKLCNDYSFAREAIVKDGNALRYFGQEIRSEKVFNLLAVKQDPLSYRHFIDEMKMDRDIISTALEGNGFLYHFIREKDKQNEDFLKIALKNSGEYTELIYKECPTVLRERVDISLLACSQSIECLKNISFKTFFKEEFQKGIDEILDKNKQMYIESDSSEESDSTLSSYDHYINRLLTEANKRCEVEQADYIKQKTIKEEELRDIYSEGENLLED